MAVLATGALFDGQRLLSWRRSLVLNAGSKGPIDAEIVLMDNDDGGKGDGNNFNHCSNAHV